MHRLLFILFPCLTLVGCGETGPEYTERKRVDEPLREREVAKFLRILEDLPEGPLESMQPVFAPLPNWDRTRTLPVSELLRLERESLEQRWNVDWLVNRAKPSRRLQRLLAREKMTHGQFVAMALSIGAALRRSTVHPDQILPDIVETGREKWRELEGDQRPFASLPPDDQYRTLQQAAWLVRSHRADRLDLVPEENAELVAGYRDRLAPYYPPEFLENPFDAILDPLEEYGIPFHESGPTDPPLEWTRETALRGTDTADPEFQTDSGASAW